MSRSLYICYFGVREPLVQTQVIPYLRELVKGGYELSLLTFEAGSFDPKIRDGIRAKLLSEGIEWHSLRYHKRFSALATAYDVLAGALVLRRLIAREKIDLLHGRVHTPTLMGALARRLSTRKPKLLFDIRGFFPEEYTDAGVWPENGVIYRTAKRVERWLMKETDGFVVLTHKACEILFGSGDAGLDKPVEVIPCCVDIDERFSGVTDETRVGMRRRLGVEDRFVITHVGV